MLEYPRLERKESKLTCPRCRGRKLVIRHQFTVEIDVCGNCFGAWFDRGEVEAFVKKSQPRNRHPAQKLEVKDLISCPKCTRFMNVAEKTSPVNHHAHVCPKGEGLWLDGAEIRKLLPEVKIKPLQKVPKQSAWDVFDTTKPAEVALDLFDIFDFFD